MADKPSQIVVELCGLCTALKEQLENLMYVEIWRAHAQNAFLELVILGLCYLRFFFLRGVIDFQLALDPCHVDFINSGILFGV